MMAQLGFCSMMSLISCFWPQFPFVDKGGLHLLKVSPIFPWPISNPRCPKSGAASGVRLSLGLADTRGPGNSPGNLGGGSLQRSWLWGTRSHGHPRPVHQNKEITKPDSGKGHWEFLCGTGWRNWARPLGQSRLGPNYFCPVWGVWTDEIPAAFHQNTFPLSPGSMWFKFIVT